MNKIYVSIGSCIDRKWNVSAALRELRSSYGRLDCSSVYETEAVGFEGDNFYNLVVCLETKDSPAMVKCHLKAIENRLGRSRPKSGAQPCNIDLDLILYGQLVRNASGLCLPRDEVLRYAYVLEPLAELAPEQFYPGSRQTYRELWTQYRMLHHSPPACILDWNPLGELYGCKGWCYPDYTLVAAR